MKFSPFLALALTANVAVASLWPTRAIYNKWHETELERWLSDHSIPYPTPADRKDLENLIKAQWDSKVVTPYNEWEPSQLQTYLEARGSDVADAAASGKDALVSQVAESWTDTTDTVDGAYSNVRDWIFDSWTDSQLKAFCDKHGIPVPQPRKRDQLLQTVRSNYESAAKKINEYIHYPGDWLYESWSDSDLKQFLDERGIPAPQPTSRDKLVAEVRRNARSASLALQKAASSASNSASAAQQSLSDLVFDSWSDSKLKEWADEHGIKVPQGSKRNEVLAIVRKHRHNLLESASSEFGAATTKAGNEYARATNTAYEGVEAAFDKAVDAWSDTRLKAYLDSRGVPVPQSGKRDELLAKVRLHKHKAATGYSAWTFDTWTTDNIRSWLETQGEEASDATGATRDELVQRAHDSYAKASSAGGTQFASVTSYLASATDSAKNTAFDSWSESELKSYLDSYGVPTYQGSTLNELRAAARNQANYFRYGTTSPGGTMLAKLQEQLQWVLDSLKLGAASGRKEVAEKGTAAKVEAEKAASIASEKAAEAGETAKHEL